MVPLLCAFVLTACGSDSDTDETAPPNPTDEAAAEIPIVDITKTADGFDAPASIPGGLTRLRVHNADARAHAVNLLRFEGEGTLDQLTAAYTLGSTDFVAAAEEIGRLTRAVGGSGLIAPGGGSEIVLDLVPGRYVIYRFPAIGSLPGAREMEVTAAPKSYPAPPESAFTVDMLEFAFAGFPDTLPAGNG
jgi:hypothetical protein